MQNIFFSEIGAKHVKTGQTKPNGSDHGQTGSSRAKRGQMGPNRLNQCKTGPNSENLSQIWPNRANRANLDMSLHMMDDKLTQ